MCPFQLSINGCTGLGEFLKLNNKIEWIIHELINRDAERMYKKIGTEKGKKNVTSDEKTK